MTLALKKLLLIPVLLIAIAPGIARSAQVDDQSDPQALIRTATQQVLDEVRERAIAPTDIPRIRAVVNRDILPYVDFRRTTQLSMGRHWRAATPAQRDKVTEQFQLLLIHLYSGALAQLKPDQQIQYPPMRVSASETDVVVRTVALANGKQYEIDYRLYRTPAGWRVYDLNVLGAWLIQTYRQQFNETIQQSGVDGLIRFLVQRNTELAAGGGNG
ncbi:phospholipid transport system substrate-binding protein [Paraburkholderia caballeronis]|nr:phospholipid transport system substrate-binding protein [Paraburkholderia caballeronis]TDV08371.1 phospholipid transport system substrate-binding protein [Paraburkholderia caballeronis]TDV19728.1 phospholipid transport system substrate-binding protein [Paraburkholderia caballeronis]